MQLEPTISLVAERLANDSPIIILLKRRGEQNNNEHATIHIHCKFRQISIFTEQNNNLKGKVSSGKGQDIPLFIFMPIS